MATDKLKLSIGELRDQIEQLDVKDQRTRARIEQLLFDLERQLGHPRDQQEVRELHERMPGLIEQFEVQHPRLTRVLDQIMVTLSSMGI